MDFTWLLTISNYISRELACCRLCERHLHQGFSAGTSSVPQGAFGNVRTHLLIVQKFYLNVKFSKFIKTNYERDRKMENQTPCSPGDPCIGMAVVPVITVQLAYEGS